MHKAEKLKSVLDRSLVDYSNPNFVPNFTASPHQRMKFPLPKGVDLKRRRRNFNPVDDGKQGFQPWTPGFYPGKIDIGRQIKLGIARVLGLIEPEKDALLFPLVFKAAVDIFNAKSGSYIQPSGPSGRFLVHKRRGIDRSPNG